MKTKVIRISETLYSNMIMFVPPRNVVGYYIVPKTGTKAHILNVYQSDNSNERKRK